MSLLAMLVMLAVWNFSYALITLSTSLEAKLLWLKIENIGILTVPIFWFFFALRYNRLDGWLNRYTASLFFIIPAISLLFLFSTQWFHLYYASVRQAPEGGGPLMIERGPWYVVAAPVCVSCESGGDCITYPTSATAPQYLSQADVCVDCRGLDSNSGSMWRINWRSAFYPNPPCILT
jgi:hypothetical protein